MYAIAVMDSMIMSWDVNSHARRLPRYRLNNGKGNLSTRGAQTNLKE
jgi:hypothetical protein